MIDEVKKSWKSWSAVDDEVIDCPMGLNGLTTTGCSSSDQLYPMVIDYNKVCMLVIVSTYSMSFITSLEIGTVSFSLIENVFKLVIVNSA